MKHAILALMISLSAGASAQHLRCGTDELMKKELLAHPELQELYEQNKREIPDAGEGNRAEGDRELIFIPVVFHIIHNGDAVGTGENISDAQVLSQIEALNRDFSGDNADGSTIPTIFKSLQAKSNIRFCIAKFDPDGNPTNGIDRQNLGMAGWDENEIEGQIKPATIWDRSRYLNIWSVNMSGSLLTDGVLAYARFPFMANNNNDGVVARYNTIGTTGSLLSSYRLGRTIVHEVGHWLNLFHNWGDDNGACTGSDYVNDTPNQADLYFGCPSFPQVSCSSSDMFMNYMDYTDDDCRTMFTIGQNTRMTTTLGSTRANLRNSASNCFYNLDADLLEIIHPRNTSCTGVISPLIKVKNDGIVAMNSLTFGISIDNAPQTNAAWTGLIISQDELFIQLDPISIGSGQHSIQITINTVNGNATDDNSGNNTALVNFTVTPTSSASSVPLINDFEDGVFPPFNWESMNPNNDLSWALETGISANGSGNQCISMDNFSSATNTTRRIDDMLSDEYNLSGMGSATLSFDLAYAARSDVRSDSLLVSYSLDCGASWNRIYGKPGSAIAPSAFSAAAFVPSASQWRNEVVDLNFLAGQPTVKFKFSNVSGWGNKLYLDNINVSAIPSSITDLQGPDFSVFPNPGTGYFIIRQDANQSYTHMEVHNLMGQLVYESEMQQTTQALDLSSMPSGMYVLKLSSKSFVRTSLIQIQK